MVSIIPLISNSSSLFNIYLGNVLCAPNTTDTSTFHYVCFSDRQYVMSLYIKILLNFNVPFILNGFWFVDIPFVCMTTDTSTFRSFLDLWQALNSYFIFGFFYFLFVLRWVVKIHQTASFIFLNNKHYVCFSGRQYVMDLYIKIP